VFGLIVGVCVFGFDRVGVSLLPSLCYKTVGGRLAGIERGKERHQAWKQRQTISFSLSLLIDLSIHRMTSIDYLS
jgi:hypothetical protein